MRPKLFAALLAALIVAAVAASPAALATGDHAGGHETPGEHGTGTGNDPGYDAPCLAIDLDEESPANAACDDLPHFRSSFLNRVWTFKGAVDWFQNTDDHVLSVTLDRIENLPRRFRRQDDDLLDQDLSVLLSERTRVYDPEGYRIDHDRLEDAEYVKVRGKLLAPRRWRASEDGDLVPTVRAKRIYVTEWSRGAERGEEDVEPEAEEPEAEEPRCPLPTVGWPYRGDDCDY